MNNFSKSYCLVMLLIFRITACKADNSNTTRIEIDDSDDVSGSAEVVSGSDLKFNPDVCKLPIDEGDCRNESRVTNEDSDSLSLSNGIKVFNKLNDSNELNESHESNERNELNESNERNELNESNESNERNELNESNESNTLYFGYNKSTKKCEQFNYSGCGGNENRFKSINECRKTCYTPLKKFLTKVSDLLVFRVSNSSSKSPAT